MGHSETLLIPIFFGSSPITLCKQITRKMYRKNDESGELETVLCSARKNPLREKLCKMLGKILHSWTQDKLMFKILSKPKTCLNIRATLNKLNNVKKCGSERLMWTTTAAVTPTQNVVDGSDERFSNGLELCAGAFASFSVDDTTWNEYFSCSQYCKLFLIKFTRLYVVHLRWLFFLVKAIIFYVFVIKNIRSRLILNNQKVFIQFY